MTAKVTFDSDRCKGCELCASVCPKHIVAIDQTVINRNGHHGMHRLRQLRQDLPRFHHHRREVLKKEVIHSGKGTLER